MTSRIDIIAQNGNNGSHYKVEAIARIIAGKDADMKMGGKNANRKRWELFVPKAMEILNYLEEIEYDV